MWSPEKCRTCENYLDFDITYDECEDTYYEVVVCDYCNKVIKNRTLKV